MKSYFFTALLGLSALSSCKATTNTSQTGDPVITLKMGEEKVLPNSKLKIKFVAVPEDSRCPINVRCVWIGNARVQLKVNNKTVNLDTQDMPERKYARIQSVDGYQYSLENLQPNKTTSNEIQPREYVIQLRVEKISDHKK
ncbi:hypothetical protein [Elizabethkingia meningoseptica]|uniref:hypothetical protein n=1 Tax=Elizabethkingia meningoseptica TaxID=238 RepID=UPI0038927A58